MRMRKPPPRPHLSPQMAERALIGALVRARSYVRWLANDVCQCFSPVVFHHRLKVPTALSAIHRSAQWPRHAFRIQLVQLRCVPGLCCRSHELP